ncbi:DUF4127 family protein [Cohnella nanjingensis]|uniref:DUF4127 family protein n=1 Tax=Cohnella nanjingensis TaxID=1387779 RepID=A0A7X0VGN5_9BACL|nr:DUF4127 family protein [Cohnella nanjingensis]MBB6673300.1 DUF4127 family protein [Cohnella nanjingensis]
MSAIVYLPLDERPCNAAYPVRIAAASDVRLTAPPRAMLGDKKRPADTAALAEWLLAQSAEASRLIVSLDMLVYGGIVPSRLHHLSEAQCQARLNVIKSCKERNPALRIFAFNLIMRAPAYSSSDEEPDYYADYGAELARLGALQDQLARDGLDEDAQAELERLTAYVPEAVRLDFTDRRRINTTVNRMAIDLVKENVIDFLLIPLDDNAKYGYSSSEQRNLLLRVEKLGLLDRIHLYPGADEIGNTLFARAFCELKGYQPEIYIRHASTSGPFSIPKYEDRSLGESLKAQIHAAGGFIGDHASEADFVLMVNSPPVGQHDMAETTTALADRHASYFSEVNLREFAEAIARYTAKGRMVALADVATCNGSDEPLMKLLSRWGLLPKIAAYAGWNTSGNTLGTVIAHAIVESYYRGAAQRAGGLQSREAGGAAGELGGKKQGTPSAFGEQQGGAGGQVDVQAGESTGAAWEAERARNSESFYVSRLLEDWGYQAIVRTDIAWNHLEALGGNYFDVSAIHGEISALVLAKLTAFAETYLQDLDPSRFLLDNVEMPWRRMFEVGFELRLA